ncbi:DUF3139 domain-containing protein [Listeria monocytogenes]|uniref:DUF3139 domain-containing protein n=5 Tax=Listeria monocytogenes TaxID=1639 RepID=A0A9P1T753_LISMN|nr:DUF3139 domain-containing protein [Listeria monocytogenes]EAA0164379.1 DUF3139 domain-containing protein [Listeria monocytogenes serotype 1/2a]EAE6023145.1 DUF3139 domain-containing protein [Listeria monocytogenes serotype 3a]EAG6283263.1 DUF3139 domain-containing protein [Listeria monocytogenes CFSAN003810]EAH4129455.1 DUF3139 domain-containing protein [Listeria monocytogenes LIS0077]EHC6175388.1 DUF3139 domain-containing protein [Listeria monocytogenes serotype 1/2b]MCY49300.1 DUF3139 do
MKKYKKWWITIGIIFLLSVIGYVYWFAIPKNTANKAVGNYLAEQKIKSSQIDTRVIKKDWKMGGYLTTIIFKDDPNLKYEYSYDERIDLPYHVFVDAYKDGSGQTEGEMKHPPLEEQLKEMNKSK